MPTTIRLPRFSSDLNHLMRRITALLLAFATSIGLTACQNFGRPSEAEIAAAARQMPGEKEIAARFEEVSSLYRDICTAPEYEPYFAKTPCLPPLATRKQLSDRTYITDVEAGAMRGVVRETTDLNRQTRELMRKTGIDTYVRRANHAENVLDPLIRENQEALLNRRITWGVYNQKRNELARLAPEEEQLFEGATIELETKH